MRDEFVEAFKLLAKKDKNIILLTADLGFGVFDEIENDFPNQFLNVGIAEQNMIGIATGLALEGMKVFVYSIGNFPTLRCLEQIRNDASYHKVNVNIVAMGGGFSYGSLGMSHHATEDLSIMRSLPGVEIISPGTKEEAYFATQLVAEREGVSYLRLDKSFYSPKRCFQFKVGKAITYEEIGLISIVTVGGILNEVMLAAKKLKDIGIACKVIHFHTIKPFDFQRLEEIIKSSEFIISVEEHNICGGLSTTISEYCLKSGNFPQNFKSLALKDGFSSIVGSQDYLRNIYKIDHQAIINSVLSFINSEN